MGIFDVLRGSKTGDRIVAELQARTLSERQSLIAEREQIRSVGEAACHELQAKRAQAERAMTAAKMALETALSNFNSASVAASSRSAQLQGAVSRIDRALELGADSRIGDFIARIQDRFEGERHSLSGAAATGYFAGLQNAQRQAAALRLRAMTDDELSAELTAIETAIPSRYPQAVAA